jgi:hypothetical protein
VKVTFHTGFIMDGEICSSVTQDVEMPDDCLPTDIERELKAWSGGKTFTSYDTHVEVLPETPSSEAHAVH